MVLQIVTQLLQSRDPITGYAFALVSFAQYSLEDIIQLFRMVEEPGRNLLALHQGLAQYFRFGYYHILIAHLQKNERYYEYLAHKKYRHSLGYDISRIK